MKEVGYPFTVITKDTEESADSSLGLEGLATLNAELKAKAVYNSVDEESLVIGSDTVVWLEGKAYGKPKDYEEALQMLSELSGKTHQVGTGVALVGEDGIQSFCQITEVTFKSLSKEEIQQYVDSVEVMDKAGSYAIQDGGDRIVASIKGEFDNVMGFPVNAVKDAIENFFRRNKKFSSTDSL